MKARNLRTIKRLLGDNRVPDEYKRAARAAVQQTNDEKRLLPAKMIGSLKLLTLTKREAEWLANNRHDLTAHIVIVARNNLNTDPLDPQYRKEWNDVLADWREERGWK